MHIIVLIKQVPEMDKVLFDSEKGRVDRKSAGVEVNPFDLNALETAVGIKEKTGAEISVLSMGPSRAEEALKEAVARGADNAYLLNDQQFAGADTIATSASLAAAVETIGDYDLIIAGEMSVDGDTAQVGPQTAEFLNINHAAYVSELISVEEDEIEIKTSLWQANYSKTFTYPLLITVTKDINTPRLPSFKDKMKARKAEVKLLTFEDIKNKVKIDEVGFKGSPTWVDNIVVPEEISRKTKVFTEEEKESAYKKIKELLIEKNLMED
ncbi:electron transfer flavoprotein subunit beta/FixA family protein [Halanaerobium hydrogeniformans]|uniref:Electron transfer flavoprotein small subunit n=1 Tax=Halanaerobium hydrogeniformans TaxID=656519 RepID=E4RLM8_HALHG|nr:electron transfer flavoprotein subunit beta/FixA family protein [Halanaerobium hydrogeniformans]ADQ14942.1 Electron transfer flavoprotein alpha/beta-subunit [Halanaerobium hydrogeniformans]